ncbi:MAG TPA: O-antigen ligase family protein [Chitinophagales bacterium]|nr:O-antigen ligase family protein [Chitinophagales bacterium]
MANIFPDTSFIYKVFYFFVFATILVLPFHKIFASFPLTFAGMAGVLALLFSSGVKSGNRRSEMLLWCLLFLAFLPGFFIANNPLIAWEDVSGKLYLFAIPLLFFFLKPPDEKLFHRMLGLFVFSCFAFIIISVVIAIYNFLVHGVSHFFYKELVSFTTMHPSYIGMYINFAIVITGIYFFRNNFQFYKKQKIFYLIALSIMFVYLLLLTAKTAILIGFASLIFMFVYWGKQQGKLKLAITYLILALLLLSAIALANKDIRTRVGMLFNYKEVNYDNSVLSRQYQWLSAWQLINDSNWQGVGADVSTDKLVEYYAKNNFQKGVDERYNTHNQYLQQAVDGGWSALLMFCIALAALLHVAFWSRRYILFFFLLILSISILTECMFETLSGIIFFALFGPLLIWEKPLNKA